MKKILIWIGAFVGLFAMLVGITFVVLLINSPDEEILIAEHSATSTDVESKALKIKQTEVDTLLIQVTELKSQILLGKSSNDSLMEQLSFKDGLILGYDKEIKKLNKIVMDNEKQSISMKELAKTYASMKSSEMKPILSSVDDATVLSIYKNMNASSRKTLFQALDQKRAARITEILAGTYKR